MKKYFSLSSLIIMSFVIVSIMNACSSSGTIKVNVNVSADTIKITNSNHEILACVTGQNQAEATRLSAGKYFVEIISAGYVKQKKAVTLEKNTTVVENFTLQADEEAAENELKAAKEILLGTWSGEFGSTSMNLVLEEIKPGTLKGYDITNGKKRTINGTYRYENDRYSLILNEPGNNRDEGQFVLAVDKKGGTASGSWKSFDKKMKYAVEFSKEKESKITGENKEKESVSSSGNTTKPKRLLRILNATYGTARKSINVTSLLNSKINNDNIWVEVSNATFGDPDPGKPKTLTVSYEYRGVVYNKFLKEKMIFRVP